MHLILSKEKSLNILLKKVQNLNLSITKDKLLFIKHVFNVIFPLFNTLLKKLLRLKKTKNICKNLILKMIIFQLYNVSLKKTLDAEKHDNRTFVEYLLSIDERCINYLLHNAFEKGTLPIVQYLIEKYAN